MVHIVQTELCMPLTALTVSVNAGSSIIRSRRTEPTHTKKEYKQFKSNIHEIWGVKRAAQMKPSIRMARALVGCMRGPNGKHGTVLAQTNDESKHVCSRAVRSLHLLAESDRLVGVSESESAAPVRLSHVCGVCARACWCGVLHTENGYCVPSRIKRSIFRLLSMYAYDISRAVLRASQPVDVTQQTAHTRRSHYRTC